LLEKRIIDSVTEHIDSFSQNSLEAFSEGLKSVIDALPAVFGNVIKAQSETAIEDWYEVFLHTDASERAAALTNSIIALW
jgi:hypothetical protein